MMKQQSDISIDSTTEDAELDAADLDVADAPQPDRRTSAADRRAADDRRKLSATDSNYRGPERRVAERRADTGLERRRGPGRRRTDDRRSAEEGEMTVEQFEFVMAIQTYKKLNRRMFPTWTEILEVVEQLGYRKIEPRSIVLQDVPEPALHEVIAKVA